MWWNIYGFNFPANSIICLLVIKRKVVFTTECNIFDIDFPGLFIMMPSRHIDYPFSARPKLWLLFFNGYPNSIFVILSSTGPGRSRTHLGSIIGWVLWSHTILFLSICQITTDTTTTHNHIPHNFPRNLQNVIPWQFDDSINVQLIQPIDNILSKLSNQFWLFIYDSLCD